MGGGVSRFIWNKSTVKEMPPVCSRKRLDLWSAAADSLYKENMNRAKKRLGWFQILMATYGASALLQPAEGCKQFGSLQPLHLNIVLPLNPLKGSEKCGARMWHLLNWWWDRLLTGLEGGEKKKIAIIYDQNLFSHRYTEDTLKDQTLRLMLLISTIEKYFSVESKKFSCLRKKQNKRNPICFSWTT